MHKHDLELNNQQLLLYNKTKPNQTNPGWSDPRVMAMKGYSTFLKALGLRPYHQMHLSVVHQDARLEEVLLLCRNAVGVFYSPSRQSDI